MKTRLGLYFSYRKNDTNVVMSKHVPLSPLLQMQTRYKEAHPSNFEFPISSLRIQKIIRCPYFCGGI